MFSSTAESKNPFVKESYSWPSFCQKLTEKGFLVPISDDTIIPPNSEALFKMCEEIKNNTVFTPKQKKDLYLLFLVPLYILRNKAFLTQASENDQEEYFYLNGINDKKENLFRTNHGFSFVNYFHWVSSDFRGTAHFYSNITRNYSDLVKLAKLFNDYCKNITEQNKTKELINDLLLNSGKVGPWWERRMPQSIKSWIIEQQKTQAQNSLNPEQEKLEVINPSSPSPSPFS